MTEPVVYTGVELTADDVETYTGGRLSAVDDETQRLLDAALAAARHYCGWHVKPLRTDVQVTVDGPGGTLLTLPTLQLVAISALSEDGDTLDVDTELTYSTLGLVRKVSGEWWSDEYGAITVTMDHGFVTAPDFDAAILEAVDRMAAAKGSGIGATGAMVMKRVDDVAYQWSPAGGDLLNKGLLEGFRLPILA